MHSAGVGETGQPPAMRQHPLWLIDERIVGKKLKLNKEGDFEVSGTCQKLLLKIIYYHNVYFYHNFMP